MALQREDCEIAETIAKCEFSKHDIITSDAHFLRSVKYVFKARIELHYFNYLVSFSCSGCKDFWLQDKASRELFDVKIQEFMSGNQNLKPGFVPEVGKACLLYSDKVGRFFRGILESVDKNICRVFLVDDAKTRTGIRENVDYMPVALARTPPFAYRCRLHGISERKTVDESKLQNCFNNNRVLVQYMGIKDEKLSVRIYTDKNHYWKLSKEDSLYPLSIFLKLASNHNISTTSFQVLYLPIHQPRRPTMVSHSLAYLVTILRHS
jgi:hypothetical protein